MWCWEAVVVAGRLGWCCGVECDHVQSVNWSCEHWRQAGWAGVVVLNVITCNQTTGAVNIGDKSVIPRAIWIGVDHCVGWLKGLHMPYSWSSRTRINKCGPNEHCVMVVFSSIVTNISRNIMPFSEENGGYGIFSYYSLWSWKFVRNSSLLSSPFFFVGSCPVLLRSLTLSVSWWVLGSSFYTVTLVVRHLLVRWVSSSLR